MHHPDNLAEQAFTALRRRQKRFGVFLGIDPQDETAFVDVQIKPSEGYTSVGHVHGV